MRKIPPPTGSTLPDSAGSLNTQEVFVICQQLVYPPCKKMADLIVVTDILSSGLGYVGDARRLLAQKTNRVFQLPAEHSFSSLEIEVLDTVEDHLYALCQKLTSAGRLKELRQGDGAAD
jgi:hypothetical protein